MADSLLQSAAGNSNSNPARNCAISDHPRQRSSHSSDGGLPMGESLIFPPTITAAVSESSDSSGDEASHMDFGTLSDMSDVFRAAQALTDKDRLEAVEERKKNAVLMDFFTSMGFSLDQLNDFKLKGLLPQTKPACKVLDDCPVLPTGSAKPTKEDKLLVPPAGSALHTTEPKNGVPQVESNSTVAVPAAGQPHTPLDSASGSKDPSWSAVVAGNAQPAASKICLQFFPPLESEGKFTITPPIAVLKKGLAQWSNSLTGQFLHSKLPFSVVEPFVQKHWGSLGLAKVLLHAKGYYVFKFNSPEDRDNVLALGPWYISNKLLCLKPWKEGIDMAQETCTKAPVWVKFHGVPYSYWTTEGLSFIASGVGKPLFLDKPTERLIPMHFARVCVEIGLHSPLPNTLSVTIINEEVESQEVVEVQVEYQNIPPRCLTCQTFGHTRLKCPKANFQWVPKTSFPTTGGSPAERATDLHARAAETTVHSYTRLPGSGSPDPLMNVPTTSTNSFASLANLDPDSPASSSSHLNNPLICKLRVVDEKDEKDRKGPLASDGDSSQDHQPSNSMGGGTGPHNTNPLSQLASPSTCVSTTPAKKRNRGKGRKSPQQTTHPHPSNG